MQDYGRGITENRFDVSCKLSRFDGAGKLVKVRDTTHRLEFTKGVFRGLADQTDSDWSGTLVVHGGRGVVGLELHADTGAFDQIFVFSPGSRKNFDFEVSSGEGPVTIAYRPKEQACHSFVRDRKGFRLENSACGKGQVVWDESGAVPLRGSYDALGFPVGSGNDSMSAFHVDDEFQFVPLPGAKKPFLFPKRVVAVFDFSPGKVTVDCGYALHAGRK